MTTRTRIRFGMFAAGLLLLGIAGLALLVPGYSHIQQTVSEIGEVGSPARVPFAALLCAVGLCLAVFAWGLRDLARAANRSASAAYLVGCMAVSTVGVGIFSWPHPLHNVFGLSELIGYQAPLLMALTWRGEKVSRFSWIMCALVWIAIAVNLIPVFRPEAIWPTLSPALGIVQRTLFAAWFAWCAGVGVLLSRRP